jgi:hypothetical protein
MGAALVGGMGFLDRFKKPAAAPSSPANSAAEPPPAPKPAAAVKPKLEAAREKLEMKDLAGAMAIYEEVLATGGDRADVLVTISGDLGTHGYVAEIIELIAPRYDAERHGPATGLNLLQAYLAVRNADAAQHVLDILFSLQRPELEERLHGFSNAIAELLNHTAPETEPIDGPAALPVARVGLVTISKPIWFYGLEPVADEVLPSKEGRLRRIAFGQLAVLGYPDALAAMDRPEDELGRLSRGLPLWFAETFYFSSHYAPLGAVAIVTPPDRSTRFMIFGAEWTTENLRQLVDSSSGGLDYIVTGALRAVSGDYELVLRIFEVKGFRERKKWLVRWTPGTADAELAKLHGELRRYMEWSAAPDGMTYREPESPSAWIETLGASASLFVAEKNVVDRELLRPVEPDLDHAAAHATDSEAASLAWLAMAGRAEKLGAAVPPVTLMGTPLVRRAEGSLGS